MELKKCYKCGKEKVAILNKEDIELRKQNSQTSVLSKENPIKMLRMTYGKKIGQYFCKCCKDN